MQSYFPFPNDKLSHIAIPLGALSTFLSERMQIIWIKIRESNFNDKKIQGIN